MIDQPRVDSGLGMFERLQQLLPHPAVEAIARTEFDLGTVDQQAVDRDRETIGRHRGAIMVGNHPRPVAHVGPCQEPARSRASKIVRDRIIPLQADCIDRSEEHTSELQSLIRISYAVFCLKKKKTTVNKRQLTHQLNTLAYA